jgi:hypothetical protein
MSLISVARRYHGPRYNVADYGAVGDGVTDATAAIQAVIDLVTTDAVIDFYTGTFLIGAAGLNIANKTNVLIRANGAKLKVNAVSTQSPAGLGSTVVYLDTCTNVTFTGFEIDGNAKASNLVGLKGCTGCEVSGIKASSGGLFGQIFALNNARCRYVGNTLVSGSGTTRGIWAGNYVAGHMEADCLISENTILSMPATGIVCASVGGRVAENYVSGCAGSGVIFGGASGFSSKHISIVGNVLRSNTFHGIQGDAIYTTDADLPVGIVMSDNVCELNLGCGIYAANVAGVTISGNACVNNNSDASGSGHGIYVDEARDVTITGNYCGDTRAGASRTQTSGITVASTIGTVQVNNVSVVGNACKNNLLNGVNVFANSTFTLTGVAVVGNQCTGNGSRGIVATEVTAGTVTRLVVEANVCADNTTTDIRIDPLDAGIAGNQYATESGVQYYSFADLDTTPSVKGGRSLFRAANTGATSITAFDDGVNGQSFTVYFTNANTTIVHSVSLVLPGAANITAPSNSFMRFYRIGTVWFEAGTIGNAPATTTSKGIVELATDGESAANVVVQGNDARMSNARTPTAHATSHQNGGSDEVSVAGLSGLLADGQTPLAHATSHKSGGTDAIKLDELAAPTDITTLNATTSAHGLMQKYPGGTTTFLRADGSFAAPPGGGGGSFTPVIVEKDLGSLPLYSGTFDITGLSGLTAGNHVYIQQAAGPYTGKGDRQDEAEMDQANVTAYCVDATTVRAYWVCQPKGGPMAGNVKFAYIPGA